MKAIVYTSNTGSAKTYAQLLSDHTGLPVLSLSEAAKTLEAGTEIVYLGWVMAGHVQGLPDAQKRYTVRAVGAVGMTSSPEMMASVRAANKLDDAMPLFLMQGAYDKTKLRGMYRFVMHFVGAMLEKKFQPCLCAGRRRNAFSICSERVEAASVRKNCRKCLIGIK